MKIKSPLTHRKEVEPLCDSGANELFCGIEPYNWRRKYKDFSINQRPIEANFTRLDDLEKAIHIAHLHKARVHVAMNAFFYLEGQYKIAQSIVRDVLGVGADGIIFADPGLVSIIDKRLLRNKDVIIGCDAAIFNSSAAKFYKRLGATRIVLPRSMTINEIEDVVKSDNSLEYEAFIIHDLCFFEDGFCAYCKEESGGIKKEGRGRKKIYLFTSSRLSGRGYTGGCRSKFHRHKISLVNGREIKHEKRFSFWNKKHIEGCGSCAIYDFKKIGIASLKVLDRQKPVHEKVEATAYIKKSLGFLENNNISRLEYADKCKLLFEDTFKSRCSKYDCYYP